MHEILGHIHMPSSLESVCRGRWEPGGTQQKIACTYSCRCAHQLQQQRAKERQILKAINVENVYGDFCIREQSSELTDSHRLKLADGYLLQMLQFTVW